jgi:hypothetical protein
MTCLNSRGTVRKVVGVLLGGRFWGGEDGILGVLGVKIYSSRGKERNVVGILVSVFFGSSTCSN